MGVDYSYNTRDIRLGFAALDISEEFRTETGYLTREGVSTARASLGPKFYPKDHFIKSVNPSFTTEHTRDKFGDIWESNNELSLGFVLSRSSKISLLYRYSSEVFGGEEFDTSGVKMSGESQFTKELFLQVALGAAKAIYYSADPYQGSRKDATVTVIFQPSDKLNSTFDLTYTEFHREADSELVYDYTIARLRTTYQMNKYLFFRGIIENNSFHDRLLTDFLASFTYIPGTVVHFGYGSVYEKLRREDGRYLPAERFLEAQRGFFFKASYLWRL